MVRSKRKNIKRKVEKIKMIGMDIDGVLTPGDIVIMESGEEVKSWNVKDRIAFRLARNAGGIKFAWISGRKCKQVKERAKDLEIEAVYLKELDKLRAFKEILRKFKLEKDEFAYIGDDLVDISILKRCGFSVCPKDSPEELKEVCDYVSKYDGGRGVLREVVEIVLKSQNRWEKATEKYYK